MEATSNNLIEEALELEHVEQATNLCIQFLEQVYGSKAVKLWALRDFVATHISEDPDFRSRFDNNALKLFELRKEKMLRSNFKPKYESAYFKDSYLEELDNIFEDYQNRVTGGRPSKAKFLKLIKQAVEDLPIA